MSLPTALKVVALLVVGLVLIPAFVAMGPLGWAVIGSMILVGAVQVHRSRKRDSRADDGLPKYCPNCGTELDDDVFGGEADGDWKVGYCIECGVPIEAGSDDEDSVAKRTNCPDCGAPNESGADECEYCDAEL